jgi:outer membrane protein X
LIRKRWTKIIALEIIRNRKNIGNLKDFSECLADTNENLIKKMKKLFLTLAVALICVCAQAQVKGDVGVGLNLSYGTEISNIGIGVKGQYNFTDAIRGEVSFDYFLKKDGNKMWDVNVNAHYLFSVAEKFKVYPLVGLTYANCSWDYDLSDLMQGYEGDEETSGSSSEGRFGVNLGAGASYDITSKIAINFEIKYQIISNYNQVVFGIGAAYRF